MLKADKLPEAKRELPTVYVTVSIVPYQKLTKNDYEFKSEVQKCSSSPIFNEDFEFDVTDINIHEMYLRFVVWYMDSYSQGECLGVVDQNLSTLKQILSDMETETVISKDIQPISQVFILDHSRLVYHLMHVQVLPLYTDTNALGMITLTMSYFTFIWPCTSTWMI